MKKLITAILCTLALCTAPAAHAGLEHMTPKPAFMSVGNEQITLSPGLTVGYSADLSTEMTAEITKFVGTINALTNLNATTATGQGFINVAPADNLASEAYTLDITAEGINITAATPTGLFYAFQTLKKLMPVNVAAGVAGAADATYTLPVVNIADAPRFPYRGFMLDVSRHFFDVAQIKRMLDIMAVYKLNRFHWHLTDDQGWRLPVAKYPKLTVEGATNYDVLLTNFTDQTQVGSGTTYGPYAYTADEIRDIVSYAADRHIQVIPEIDMPGHMVAAIHAYPEFSTQPESTDATYDHHIWNRGGVSTDVLDVSNPKVIEFVKDVVDVLADLFPYEYIHIGGDECPTSAWTASTACQNFMTEKGITTERGLQSWFTREIATYAREQHGKKVMGWNEIITSGGTDMDMINEIKPTIFCWLGGEAKAQENGLDHVYTPFNGGYYINRSYAGIDKVGAVRDGALSVTLSVNPPTNSHCIGVQGTFWTEQVDRPTDLEYLALPRLIGIAEQGWAPQEKDIEEIMTRLVADRELLDAAGYNYGAHQLVVPTYQTPQPGVWYTISSSCTDERAGNVIEVLSPSHPFITSKSANGAAAYRLWGNKAKAGNLYQQFSFVEDPSNAGHYAIVCRAIPSGSLSATPSGNGTGDRWTYNTDGLDYSFTLDRGYYAENEDGTFRYAIRSTACPDYHLNFSRDRQGQAINVYADPNDGAGGHMTFTAIDTNALQSIAAPALTAETAVYDILGRRLAAPARGLNIINGHKIIL